jgi:tetratricopeptide (TPR) repeat protein
MGFTYRAAVAACALIVCLTASADELTRYNREVGRLLEKGSNSEALGLAERAVEIAKGSVAESDPASLEALRNLARLLRWSGNNERALAILERVLEMRETPATLDELAELHRSTNAFDEALPLYERSLALREAELGSEHEQLVPSLLSLAGLHQRLADHRRARPFLERAVAIQEKTLGPDHPALLESVRFLAAICQTLGDGGCAATQNKRAAAIEQRSAGRLPAADPALGAIAISVQTNPTMGSALGGKGQMNAAKVYFVRVGDVGDAGAPWHQHSWAERERLLRRTDDVVESTFHDGNDVYLLNVEPGRYVAVGALMLHKAPGQTIAFPAALSADIMARTEVTVGAGELVFMGEVRGSVRGNPDPAQRYAFRRLPDNPLPVVFVRGLGSLSYRRQPQWVKLQQVEVGGKAEASVWKRARGSFKQEELWLPRIPAKDAVGESLPGPLQKVWQTAQRASDSLGSGNFGEAVSLSEKTLRGCEGLATHQDHCLQAAVGNLAELAALYDVARARELYDRLATMREGHPALAGTRMAGALLEPDAEEPAAAALALAEERFGGEHLIVADLLEQLRQSDAATAAATLGRALRIREDALGWTHPSLAPLLDRLAAVEVERGEAVRAAEHATRAVEIRRRFLEENHPLIAESLSLRAAANAAAGDEELAASTLDEALFVLTEADAEESGLAIDVLQRLASIRRGQGATDDADGFGERADLASRGKAVRDLGAIGEAMLKHAVDRGSYPVAADAEALRAALQPRYIRSMALVDGWGNPYAIRSDASGYELRSLGKDGQPDTGRPGTNSGLAADIIYADGNFTQLPGGR